MIFLSPSQSLGFWVCPIWWMVRKKTWRKLRKGHYLPTWGNSVGIPEWIIFPFVNITWICVNLIQSSKILVTSSGPSKASLDTDAFGIWLWCKNIRRKFIFHLLSVSLCNFVSAWFWICSFCLYVMTWNSNDFILTV